MSTKHVALRLSALSAAVLIAMSRADAQESDAALAAVAANAAAGSGVEELIVVRSRNRLEPLQDVPISISVVNGSELEREHALDLGDITKRAANVTWNTGNPRQGSLSIRGVGKQGQTDAQDPSVGVIVDGVNYAYNALSFYDFTDVDSVEVTRGPQGTLLGKNTTMGVVNIITKAPSFEPDFNYSLTFGERDAVIGTAAGGGPVIDDVLAWRGTFYVDKQDGAYENLYDLGGDRTYQNKNRMYGRAQLLLTPTENFSARFALELAPRSGENTNGLTYYKDTPPFYSNGTPVNLNNDASTRLARRWFAQEGNYTYRDDYIGSGLQGAVNNDRQMPLVTGTAGVSAWLDWDVGNFTLTSITAAKEYYFQARNDEGTPFDITLNSNTTVRYDQQSQELRLSSATGGLVDYQAGIFLLNSQNRTNSKLEWGSDAGAWFATGGQYTTLDRDTNGRYLLQNALDRAYRLRTDHIDNKSSAVFGQANWHFTDRFTLTTGARFTHDDRTNSTEHGITTSGYGHELNPVAVNGVLLGGFASSGTGALAPGNTQEQLALADFTANKYFGVAITATTGQAYSSLTGPQLAQVAAAKALRASQIGTLWNPTDAEPFKDTQPAYVLSPTFRINDNLTFYASYQYGEKAGISQFTNGLSNNALAEKNTAYEVGLKSVLLNRTLVLNTDVFINTIKDYQQSVQVLDEYTTNLRNDGEFYYTAATGNVPRVRVEGLEIDATYNGFENLSLRFSGAYNDAIYEEFPNSAQPSENGYAGAPPFRDISGFQLAGAPKYSFSLGGEYRVPVFTNKEFHTSFNVFYTDDYNFDNTGSEYGWIDAYSVTDWSIGIGSADRGFDVSVIVKNLTDTQYRNEGWSSWSPSPPRWMGVVLRGSL